MFRKIGYYFYLTISKLVNKAHYEAKIYNVRKVATYDKSVVISPAANIVNAQLDKSKIVLGSNVLVQGTLIVFGFGGRIEIGSDTFIGPGVQIWSAKSIKIGSHVLVAHNVNIVDNISHPKNHLERRKDWEHIRTKGYRMTNDYDIKEKEIIIGDDVWLGHDSSVLRGVTIGNGAIIGANTIVTGDIPPFAIVVGNPAKIIGYSD